MRGKKTFVLDFSGIKARWELHEFLKEIFRLPDYYGRNLDALWDCLYCCYDSNTTIQLRNLNKVPEDLRDEIKIMLELFWELNEKDGVIIQLDPNDTSNFSGYLV